MNITISNRMSVNAIQKAFNKKYPFLMLEFIPNVNKVLLPEEGKNTRKESSSDLIISDELTVSALVEEFARKYNLTVKVLRRSGNIWLNTSVTNYWTLRMQNQQGETLSHSIDKKTK